MVVWLEMLKYRYVKTSLATFPIQQQQELFVISNSLYLTKIYVQIFQCLKNVNGNKNGCVCGNLATCSKEMSKKTHGLEDISSLLQSTVQLCNEVPKLIVDYFTEATTVRFHLLDL